MVKYRTALVTGASSGIGAAFARELARRGSDLVVVARRTGRLEQLARELHAEYGIAVEVLAADLANPAGLAKVEARAAAGVDLLVNNAGIGTSGRFAELPVDGEERQIRINVLAVLRLTAAALPGMIARRHGGIVNVSSVAGFQSLPGSATYSASKAFVTSFSESLAGETHGSGVHVTVVSPGFTRTTMIGEGSSVPGFLLLEADRVARAALDTVERGGPMVVPGPQWKAIAAGTRHMPRPLLRLLTRRLQPSSS
jgi:short-subunit dehydrogenase